MAQPLLPAKKLFDWFSLSLGIALLSYSIYEIIIEHLYWEFGSDAAKPASPYDWLVFLGLFSGLTLIIRSLPNKKTSLGNSYEEPSPF